MPVRSTELLRISFVCQRSSNLLFFLRAGWKVGIRGAHDGRRSAKKPVGNSERPSTHDETRPHVTKVHVWHGGAELDDGRRQCLKAVVEKDQSEQSDREFEDVLWFHGVIACSDA